jgi:hypothetical protein
VITCAEVAPRQRSAATVSRFCAMYAPIALATPMPPSSSAKVPTSPRKSPSRPSARSSRACCCSAVRTVVPAARSCRPKAVLNCRAAAGGIFTNAS